MKSSKLLASTMLVSAAALMAAAPASAAKLKLGGYYEQWFGFGADGTANPVSNFDVKHDAEIHFSFKQKLNNGLTVGGKLEMEAGNGNPGSGVDAFDETSLYMSGGFGKIQMGNNDVASASAGGVSVVGPVGIIKSDAGDWIAATGSLNNSDNDLGMGDAQNITYMTPKMNGLQMSVSYTPDASDGASSDYDDSETSGIQDGISALVKYSGKMGSTSMSVGVGYSQVESDGTDLDGYNVGLKVSSGAVTFTTAYAFEDISATREDSFIGAGIIYKMDKMHKVSVGYGKGERDTGTSNADREENVATLGIERNLGGGVSASASVFRRETNNDTGTNVDDVGAAAGLKVKF